LKIDHDTFAKGLEIHRNDTTNAASIVFSNNSGQAGILYATIADGHLRWRPNDTSEANEIWHAGNLTNNQANWNTAYGWGNHASESYATETYVGTAISNLVDSSPAALNTLNELAAALGDDPNFATTVTDSIAAKLPLTGGTVSGNLSVTGTTTSDKLIVGSNTVGTESDIALSSQAAINAQNNLSFGMTNASTGYYRWMFGNTSNTGGTAGGVEKMKLDPSGNLTLSGTVDGVDVGARNAVLTSTKITADAALSKDGTSTGDYSTSGAIQAGRGGAGVALTINDGYGNANVTFNHKSGVPEQTGNAARIEFNADGTSAPTMTFELGTGTAGTAFQTPTILTLNSAGASVSGTLSATGYNDSNWNTAYGWGDHASAGYTSNAGDIEAVVAGAGLTGGATSGNATLDVIGGDGITANTNDIAVDSTVLRTTGAQTKTGALTIDVDNQAGGALRIEANQTNPEQDFYFAEEIYSTLSGSTVTTADREQGAIYIDLNSSATGGGTSHEHRVYGIYADVDSTGDADLVYGVHATATATPTTGQTTTVTGGYFWAEDNGGAGAVSSLHGVQSFAFSDNATSDVNAMYAVYGKAYNAVDSAAIAAATGVYGEIEVTSGSADIYGTSKVFEAQYDNNSGIAQTNTTYLYYGNYAGVLPTTAYGVYIADTVPNTFLGTLRLGDGSTSAASYGFEADVNTGMYSPANHELGFLTNGTQRLKLDSTTATFAGNINLANDKKLNIGTSTGDAFNADSAICIEDTSNSYLQIKTGTAAQCGVLLGDTADDYVGGMIYQNNGNKLTFNAANALQLTLESGAATFAGTLSATGYNDSNWNTAYTYSQVGHLPLDGGSITGDVSVSGTLSVRTAIDLADSDILRFGSGDDTEFFCNGTHMYMDLNAGIGNFYIRDGTTTRYTFNDNGNFTATGNITAYSDIRLKEDIKPIEDAVSKVQQLTGNTYTRNDLKDPGRRYGGVIAQEVEVVLPEAVSESEDGTKAVDYNAMIALLVESVKELKSEVDDLKAQLEAK
jgi:hypothetical protein